MQKSKISVKVCQIYNFRPLKLIVQIRYIFEFSKTITGNLVKLAPVTDLAIVLHKAGEVFWIKAIAS